jgi:hypothetical protein
MNNHYHLIIETPDGNLSQGMRQLNGVYTQAFNVRYRSVGHVYQGRYKAILIQKESHLLEVCRYVVLNPVRAKVVEKPAEWRWSSYLATMGKGKPHPCLTKDWVLGQFSRKRKQAEKAYREFVAAGIGQKDIWNEIKGQSILGEDDFAERLLGYVKGYEDVKEIPKRQRYVARPGLGELLNDWPISDKRKRARGVINAVLKHGYSQKEVADHIGIHYSTVSRIMQKGK